VISAFLSQTSSDTTVSQAADIKSHSFFKGVKWDKMLELAIPPPFVPDMDSPHSLKYVRPKYLEQVSALSILSAIFALMLPCSQQ
jgi:hypothetical protein